MKLGAKKKSAKKVVKKKSAASALLAKIKAEVVRGRNKVLDESGGGFWKCVSYTRALTGAREPKTTKAAPAKKKATKG